MLLIRFPSSIFDINRASKNGAFGRLKRPVCDEEDSSTLHAHKRAMNLVLCLINLLIECREIENVIVRPHLFGSDYSTVFLEYHRCFEVCAIDVNLTTRAL